MAMNSAREAALFFQKDFSAEEVSARRAKVMKAMGGGGAVVTGASEVAGVDPVRQNNDFYYLTGVDVAHSYLTMDAGTGRSVLYLPPRDEKHQASDGPSLSAEDGEFVRNRTGIENLTVECPREMDEVERLMKEPGILQRYPATVTNPGR